MRQSAKREGAISLTNPASAQAPAIDDDEGFNIVSPLQIGESNKRRVLQTLFDLGPTSRAELARLSGSKRTTITGIVQPLLDGGLLIEEEPSGKRGVGKPARPLWFSATASPVCAVALMPGRIQTAMVSLRGEIYGEETVTLSKSESDRQHYLSAIERSITHSLSHARSRPLGVGIAVGGMTDPDTGAIVAMNLAPWLAGVELTRIVEERFGIATLIDHHPRAILMGERWFGRGRRLRDFAVVYVDEVLGCSLFLNGEPFRGPHGSGGELGHTVVAVNGEVCTCGRRGCWETIATLPWLRRRAGELGIANADALEAAALCRLARKDPAAATLLGEYARNIAVGIANLETLLMPGNFIIYGNAATGSPHLLEMIERCVKEISVRHPGETVHVMFGNKDQEAVTLRGAAGLVIADELRIRY